MREPARTDRAGHDDAAFAGLYAGERQAVVAAARAVVGDQAVAHELAHDAFAVAYADWGRVRHLDRPGAWVRRVAIHLALKERRRRRTSVLGRPDEVPERPTPDSRGPRPPVDALVPQRVDLARALAELPPRQRTAVVLHHLHDLPVADVAEHLGCAPATVKVHLHRARRALRSRLEDAAGRVDRRPG